MSFLTITGRLGRDAELRTTQSGTKVLGFSVADNIGYGDNKTTQWVKCALFGKRGESLAPHLKKGSLVEVCGKAKVNSYEGKKGFQAEIEVSVLEINLHGGKTDKPQEETHSRPLPDDEIPF